jgi:hypothetical protein
MTEQTKETIVESFRSFFTKHVSVEMVDIIQQRVDIYNAEYLLEGEPEMTFKEMAELLNEKHGGGK